MKKVYNLKVRCSVIISIDTFGEDGNANIGEGTSRDVNFNRNPTLNLKYFGPSPEVIKLCSCSTLLSVEFQLLRKTKMLK